MVGNRIKALLLGALVALIVFTGCPTEPKTTVNQQLYPYLRIEEQGNTRTITAIAPVRNLIVPDDIPASPGITETVFAGFANEEHKSSLVSVEFMPGVDRIGSNAFKGADKLTSVTFPEDSKMHTIGNGAFQDTPLSSIELPDSLKTIGNNAFSGTELKSVDLNKVSSIGSGAFSNTGITSVYIPSSVSSVGSKAFASSSVSSVGIASGNTSIASDAFSGNAITSISIPANKTGSAKSLFGTGLVSVSISGGGNNGTSVSANAFSGMQSLSNISMSGVTSIGNSAFSSCPSLGSVTFPSGLETIGSSAFAGSGSDNTEYTLPATVKDASNAFDSDDTVFMTYEVYSGLNGNKLGDFKIQVLPESAATVENISDKIRARVPSGSGKQLSAISGEDGKKYFDINEKDFSVDSVIIKPVLPGTGTSAEEATSGIIYIDVDDKNLVYEDIGSGAVSVGLDPNSTSTNPVDIPNKYRGDDVTTIKGGDNAFDRDIVVNIQEGNSITTIEDNAFNGNTKFPSSSFDNLDKVETIGEGAFHGATSIPSVDKDDNNYKTITVPSSVKEIGKDAFTDTGAQKVVIPTSSNSDRDFSSGAFGPSTSLKKVVVEGPATGLTLDEITKAFGGDSLEANTAVNELELPSDLIKNASEEAIENLKKVFPNVEKITITHTSGSDSVNADFSAFDHLKEVVIGEGIKEVGAGAFDGIDTLEKVTLPNSLEKIGNDAFKDCGSLDSLTVGTDGPSSSLKLPEGIKEIGQDAFAGTDLGPDIVIPSTATTIGNGAFAVNDAGSGSINVTIPSDKTVGAGSYFVPSTSTGTANVTIGTLTVTEGSGKTVGQLVPSGSSNNLQIGNVVLESGITGIADNAFNGVTTPSSGISIALPDTLKTIGENAFNGVGEDSSLKITTDNGSLPSSIESIGKGAFQDSGYSSDPFGNSSSDYDKVTAISDSAFEGSNVSKVTVPASVTSVGNNAFKSDSLSQVIFEDRSDLENPSITIKDDAFAKTEGSGSITIKREDGKEGLPSGSVTFDGYPFTGSLDTLKVPADTCLNVANDDIDKGVKVEIEYSYTGAINSDNPNDTPSTSAKTDTFVVPSWGDSVTVGDDWFEDELKYYGHDFQFPGEDKNTIPSYSSVNEFLSADRDMDITWSGKEYEIEITLPSGWEVDPDTTDITFPYKATVVFGSDTEKIPSLDGIRFINKDKGLEITGAEYANEIFNQYAGSALKTELESTDLECEISIDEKNAEALTYEITIGNQTIEVQHDQTWKEALEENGIDTDGIYISTTAPTEGTGKLPADGSTIDLSSSTAKIDP